MKQDNRVYCIIKNAIIHSFSLWEFDILHESKKLARYKCDGLIIVVTREEFCGGHFYEVTINNSEGTFRKLYSCCLFPWKICRLLKTLFRKLDKRLQEENDKIADKVIKKAEETL